MNLCAKYGIRVTGIILNDVGVDGYDIQELEDNLVSLSGIDVLYKIPHMQDDNIENVTQVLQKNDFLSKL
jgi:dethiobiotin synthetase